MFKVPYDPVAQSQTRMSTKQRMQGKVERDNLGMAVNVVADLPTEAATFLENPNAFRDDNLLLGKVVVKCDPLLVMLTNVVWWRRDD